MENKILSSVEGVLFAGNGLRVVAMAAFQLESLKPAFAYFGSDIEYLNHLGLTLVGSMNLMLYI